MATSNTVPEPPSDTVEVPVGKYVALVDAADADLVSAHHWTPQMVEGGKVYAFTNVPGGRVYMHRLVAQTPADLETDHKDGNALDNRRTNLRPATPSQNQANRAKFLFRGRPASSIYKGVTWARANGRWQSRIRVNGHLKYLGYFDDEADAARAYDAAALEAWGEFARPNFPAEASA